MKDPFDPWNIIGYCSFHEREVAFHEFHFKGCWKCRYFERTNENFIYTGEAERIAGVSYRTILRWARSGKIIAKLFDCRPIPPWRYPPEAPFKVWLIYRPSLERFIKERSHPDK